MTIVRVKGFQIFADRHGRMRCYHRKSRVPADLSKSPLGSAEFFRGMRPNSRSDQSLRPCKTRYTWPPYH